MLLLVAMDHGCQGADRASEGVLKPCRPLCFYLMILSALSHRPTFTLPKTPATSSLSLSTHALSLQRGVRLQGGGKGRTHSHILVLAIHLWAAFVHDSALYVVPFQPGGSSPPIKLISLFHFLCNTLNSSSVTHTNTRTVTPPGAFPLA